MSWESAKNTLVGKSLGVIASEMSEAKIDRIVLRWKTALKSTQNVYGLLGCRTSTAERLDGGIEASGVITSDVCTFFPDENRVGYAILPRCDRNMEVLAAVYSDEKLPWTIIDEDVLREVLAMNASLFKKASPKAPQVKAVKSDSDLTLSDLVKG